MGAYGKAEQVRSWRYQDNTFVFIGKLRGMGLLILNHAIGHRLPKHLCLRAGSGTTTTPDPFALSVDETSCQ